jgi:hypothetical protein
LLIPTLTPRKSFGSSLLDESFLPEHPAQNTNSQTDSAIAANFIKKSCFIKDNQAKTQTRIRKFVGGQIKQGLDFDRSMRGANRSQRQNERRKL